MSDVRNILVGAAQLFVSRGTGVYRPLTKPGVPSASASTYGLPNAKGDLAWGTNSAKSYLLGDATNWRDLGYTNAGLEVSYEPGYNDVMVDQLLDAARLFKATIRVMLRTELTEGTLENLNLVFGQLEESLTYSGSVATSAAALTSDGTSSANLAISAGALGDAPVERTIVAVGNAPGWYGATGKTFGITGSATTQGFDANSVNHNKKERVYVARRVVQVEASTHGLKRDTATVFPVQFRCLPDDNDLYDGAEYGVVIDRVYS